MRYVGGCRRSLERKNSWSIEKSLCFVVCTAFVCCPPPPVLVLAAREENAAKASNRMKTFFFIVRADLDPSPLRMMTQLTP